MKTYFPERRVIVDVKKSTVFDKDLKCFLCSEKAILLLQETSELWDKFVSERKHLSQQAARDVANILFKDDPEIYEVHGNRAVFFLAADYHLSFVEIFHRPLVRIHLYDGHKTRMISFNYLSEDDKWKSALKDTSFLPVLTRIFETKPEIWEKAEELYNEAQ